MLGRDEFEIEPDAVPQPTGQVDNSFDCEAAAQSQGCMDHETRGPICVFPNPNSTKSYIECTNGVAYIVQCEGNSVYQDAIKACE